MASLSVEWFGYFKYFNSISVTLVLALKDPYVHTCVYKIFFVL